MVYSLNSFSSPVSLSGGWNGATQAGVATEILPSPITPVPDSTAGATLRIDASGDASTGSFTYRVTGTSGGLTHYVDVPVQINLASSVYTYTPTPTWTVHVATPGAPFAVGQPVYVSYYADVGLNGTRPLR